MVQTPVPRSRRTGTAFYVLESERHSETPEDTDGNTRILASGVSSVDDVRTHEPDDS